MGNHAVGSRRHRVSAAALAFLVSACSSSGSGASSSEKAPPSCPASAEAASPVYFEYQIQSQPVLEQTPELRARGVRGVALVQYIIGVDGVPESPSIKMLKVDSAAVGDSARTVVSSLRYRPGKIEGCPVRVLVQRPFEFR